MVSYDATVAGYVPYAFLPCRQTMTVAIINFVQEHSRTCSVSAHRTLSYDHDRTLSDVATSAACLVSLVSRQNAHDTALVVSHFRDSRSLLSDSWPPLLVPGLTRLHPLPSLVSQICLHRRRNLSF
ncbi:hypothetical protein AVEN_5925-1 [Araneus ventricosus]|uniref:Uncharacterized protein n=1 Tax=Araneus ventricosus TaxID=182803 RepID=A0A4Y2EXD1_ARAVE|nr:hypothetical protein AVEN_5925-1 [Araneus ventricosus]